MNYLTGGRRYRSTHAGLVLQVSYCWWNPNADTYGRWCNDWRDADVYDVMPIELVK